MKNYFLLFFLFIHIVSCSKSDSPGPVPNTFALTCNASVVSSPAIAGTSYNGTITLPYTGGSGSFYSSGTTITSTGVTGLTATLQGGTLATSGNLIYTITGTPSSNGTASFALSFNGQSCNISITVASNQSTNYTQYGTPFANVPATEDIVMYEVNLRAFSTAGNLQGVISRLDELKSLGVNVIWLMPIHPIGTINSVNSPYSVKDFKAVSAEYGTLEDLRTLTTQAHLKGMAVIMDWVANHTAWDNAWISNKSWYTQDASGNIVIPPGTNWQDVADLNYSNTDMRKAMIDAMKYWVLEANVDGFRSDHADGVPADFWSEAIANLRAIPNRKLIMLAEGANTVQLLNAGFDLIYAWDFYYRMKDVFAGQAATILYTTNTSEYNNVPAGKHRLRYTTNHDESAFENTPMVFFNGKQGALAASVVATFMGGVPLFYTGQEVGTQNRVPFFSKSPINWTSNPDMLLAYKSIMSVYTQNEVARKGTNTNYSTADVVAFKKTLGTNEMVVISNMRNSAINYSLPAALQNTTWTNAITNTSISLGTSLALSSYQYLILKK